MTNDNWNSERWRAEFESAWRKRGWESLDDAIRNLPRELKRPTLDRMRKAAYQPSISSVVTWARAIGEPVNKWLKIAGLPTIPAESLVPDEVIDEIIQDYRDRTPAMTDEDAETLRFIIKDTIEDHPPTKG